ncbi:MAG: hypothetical protein AB7E36_01215 [Salinivirgaceae bacterium]
MKKNKNKKQIESILNQKELSLLKGGSVKNVNWTTTCNCDYNNSSAVYNMNGTFGCSCTCTGIEKPGLET